MWQHVNKAVERRQLGDLKGALREIELAIECDPDSAAVYNARGMVKQCLDDLEGAVADFNLALKFNPKYAAAYNARGDWIVRLINMSASRRVLNLTADCR